MSWQILILLQVLLLSTGVIFLRAMARQRSLANASLAVNAVVYVFIFAGGLLSLPLLSNIEPDKFTQFFGFFIIAALTFSLSNIFSYKLLTHIEAGVGSIMAAISTLFTIILAAIFLKEDLTPIQIMGALTLLVAIIYMIHLVRKHPHKTQRPNSWYIGPFYALLVGIFGSIALVVEKYLLNHTHMSTYMFFGWGMQMLAAISMGLLFEADKFKLFKKLSTLKLLVASGVSRTLASICFVLALVKANNISVITVASSFRLIVIVLLGAIFLHEHQKLHKKLAGSVIAILGLSFIFWK
ncbi:DMT family transporter [Candidatus Saccharibacteria bacterium]|nr:DMT family transporter [Candidatus Saccharibacteria bacterium]